MTIGAYPGPLRRFLVQLDELRHDDAPVMNQVGQLLVELAADEEYFAPLIAGIPAGWHAVLHEDGRAELSLADERALRPGDVATLIPPRDVHNHGHATGTGPSPYSLILLGDDMLLFERQEYDPNQGTWRRLAPGDPG